MAQSTGVLVCGKCGQETTHGDAMMADVDGCPEDDWNDHAWCGDDPLARLVARVDASADMTVVDSEDNDNWQWVEVDCSGRDPVGDSEGLSNWVSEEGFSFLGLGDGDNVVRFNRKK